MSNIEWTEKTWNPTTGCDRVSPGCDNCYALTMAKRLKGMGSAKYQTDGNPRTSGPGFGVATHRDTLDLPLSWRKPQRVFVNSMSDLFHDRVPDSFIAQVFAVMARTPQHTYQVLTKRHSRMRSLVGGVDGSGHRLCEAAPDEHTAQVLYDAVWPLSNVWLGVSAENQQWANIRIPALLDTPAAVRFVSAEPLVGPVLLDPDWSGLGWVIVGGESGRGARPMHPDWARSLRDQCDVAGVPCFFKQAGSVLAKEWGCATSKGGDPADWPEWFPREYPQVVNV